MVVIILRARVGSPGFSHLALLLIAAGCSDFSRTLATTARPAVLQVRGMRNEMAGLQPISGAGLETCSEAVPGRR